MSPSTHARDLLREIARDPKGELRHTETFGGTFIETNGRNFTLGATAREVANWKAALKELVKASYVTETSSKCVYELTRSGYDFVDACSNQLVL